MISTCILKLLIFIFSHFRSFSWKLSVIIQTFRVLYYFYPSWNIPLPQFDQARCACYLLPIEIHSRQTLPFVPDLCSFLFIFRSIGYYSFSVLVWWPMGDFLVSTSLTKCGWILPTWNRISVSCYLPVSSYFYTRQLRVPYPEYDIVWFWY